MPTHTWIYYTITVWAVDSWDSPSPYTSGDTFVLDFNGNQSPGPYIPVAMFPNHVCGSMNWKDLGPIKIFGKISHTGNTLNLKVLSYFSEDPINESFGFRDINLLFVRNPDSSLVASTTKSLCALAPISLPNKKCGCPEGKFQSTLNAATCTSCHPACASCYGPGPNNCYQCAKGASFVQDSCIFCDASCELCRGPSPTDCITCKPDLYLYQFMCVPECPPPSNKITTGCINSCNAPCSPSNFLYWDSSCKTTCSFPLHQVTDSISVKRCVYPCGTGEYLYWDGSCQQSCPSILTTRIDIGVQYCDYGCTDAQFLYWNGTCLSTCSPPLVQVFDKGKQFCIYPCSSNEYLNFDGSCLSSCDPPFLSSTITSKKYCNHPCGNTSLFVYWDDSCQHSCLPPLQQITLPSLLACVPLCEPGQYVLWNGTCIDECKPPSTIENIYYGNKCILPCANPLDYYYEDLSLCKSSCDSYSVIADNLYFKCLAAPSAITSGLLDDLFLISLPDSDRISFLSVNKLLQPIKYLDITFPPRAKSFLLNKGRNVISLKIGNKMPSHIQDNFIGKEISGPFVDQNLHSSFLVNYWPELTSLWFVVGIGMIVYVLKIISKLLGWRFIYDFCKNTCFIPVWNFIFVLLLANVDDLILFSYLEFKTFEGDSTASVFSLLTSIIMIILLVGMLFGALYLSIKSQTLKENQSSMQSHEYQTFLYKWESCQVLFRGYNKGIFYGNFFYFFYILRLALPMIIATSYYTTPLLQTILYVLMSTITLIYVIIVNPIKSRVSHCQLIALEGILFITNFSIFLMTILEIFDNNDREINIYLGDIVILGNLLLNFLIVVFLGFKVLFGVKEAIEFRKQNNKKEERSAWFSLLFLPIQQGGAGFEKARPVESVNNVHDWKGQKLIFSQKNINLKNSSKVFSEKSLADTTHIESSLQETNPLRRSKQASYNINEEIITFTEEETVWNPTRINLPTIDEQNVSDAFPIQKIAKKF